MAQIKVRMSAIGLKGHGWDTHHYRRRGDQVRCLLAGIFRPFAVNHRIRYVIAGAAP